MSNTPEKIYVVDTNFGSAITIAEATVINRGPKMIKFWTEGAGRAFRYRRTVPVAAAHATPQSAIAAYCHEQEERIAIIEQQLADARRLLAAVLKLTQELPAL